MDEVLVFNVYIQYECFLNGDWSIKQPPFFKAVENNNIEMVELLKPKIYQSEMMSVVEFGGSGLEEAYWKTSALFEAVENENIEIVKILLSDNHPHDKHSDNQRLLNMKQGGVPYEGKWDKTELFRAIEKNNSEIVRLLVHNNVSDVDCFNFKFEKNEEYLLWRKAALYEAVEQGNAEIVKLLIPNVYDINLLNIDSELDDYDYVKSDEPNYFDRNIFRHYTKKTALYLAVQNKNIEIIKILLTNLENDLDIYNTDENGNKTVIDLANQINDNEIIKLLSDYKINNSLKNQSYYDEMIERELFKETLNPLFDKYKLEPSTIDFVNGLFYKVFSIMAKEILEKSNHINITCDDVENTISFLFSPSYINSHLAIIHTFVSNYYSDESSFTISIDNIKKFFQKTFINIDVNDDVYVYIASMIEVFFQYTDISEIFTWFYLVWNSNSKYQLNDYIDALRRRIA